MTHRLPDLTPNPYLSLGYRPGWAAKDTDPTRVLPRADLEWLDHHWSLTTEGRKPDRPSWWREHGWNGDGLVPILGAAFVALVVAVALGLVFG